MPPGALSSFGASKVVHPMMAEACVDFAARAIKEMFPPDGPAKTKILGDVTDEKTETAERKRDYMNWQLTEQIEEFRDEQEQMLTQLPLGRLTVYEDVVRRQEAPSLRRVRAIDNILLAICLCQLLHSSQRVTEQQDISEWEFASNASTVACTETSASSARRPSQSRPPPRRPTPRLKASSSKTGKTACAACTTSTHGSTSIDDDRTNGDTAPYILMIDELDSKVLGLYRNWEEGDETLDQVGLDCRVQIHPLEGRLRHWATSPHRWPSAAASDGRIAGLAGHCARQQLPDDAQAEGRESLRRSPTRLKSRR
jgi:hypothetical protein